MSWTPPALNNPVMAEIVPQHCRSLIFAFDRCFEGARLRDAHMAKVGSWWTRCTNWQVRDPAKVLSFCRHQTLHILEHKMDRAHFTFFKTRCVLEIHQFIESIA